MGRSGTPTPSSIIPPFFFFLFFFVFISSQKQTERSVFSSQSTWTVFCLAARAVQSDGTSVAPDCAVGWGEPRLGSCSLHWCCSRQKVLKTAKEREKLQSLCPWGRQQWCPGPSVATFPQALFPAKPPWGQCPCITHLCCNECARQDQGNAVNAEGWASRTAAGRPTAQPSQGLILWSSSCRCSSCSEGPKTEHSTTILWTAYTSWNFERRLLIWFGCSTNWWPPLLFVLSVRVLAGCFLTLSCATYCTEPVFGGGLGLGDFQRSLSALQFWDPKIYVLSLQSKNRMRKFYRCQS